MPVSKPHIVLHLLDDIGLADVGSSAEWATPALDGLAANGTVLSSLYVQPVCSPTRAALMTARYPFRLGLQQAIPAASTAALPDDSPTVAERLRAEGYHTVHLGERRASAAVTSAQQLQLSNIS